MKKVPRNILPILAITLVTAMASGVASAQNIPPYFFTNYYANNTTPGAPPATLRFTWDHGDDPNHENTCAMIYVYAADQQLAECCGCPVSANGLVHENVQTDLLGNTLTRVVPNEGVIQIVSGLDRDTCDPTNVIDIEYGFTAWTTHIQNKVGTTFPITETRNTPLDLSDGELATLEADCTYATRLGSGFGVCKCNPEATK